MFGSLLTSIGINLLKAFLTEAFIKNFVVHILEAAVERTDNNVDNRIVSDVKKAWGVE